MPTYNINFDTTADANQFFDYLSPGGVTGLGAGTTTRRFNIRSSTGSNGVGHSSPQAGANALFFEASSPTSANDLGFVTWKLKPGENITNINFWYNRRGNFMADLITEYFDGFSWVEADRITGVDIGSSGADIWRNKSVAIPNAVQFRWIWQFPSSGTIWNCDQAVDTVTVTTDFAQPYIIEGHTKTLAGVIVPNSTVRLLKLVGGVLTEEETQVSDGSGYFSFMVFDQDPRTAYHGSAEIVVPKAS